MVKAWLVTLFSVMREHKWYVIFSVTLAIMLVLFTAQVKAFFVITGLGLLATFSTLYKRVLQAPPVFELTTLTTVAVSVFYGPIVGALFTFVITITSEVMAQALDPFSVTYIFPRIAVAFVSPWLFAGGMDIGLLGLLMSLLYNVLQQPVYWLLTDPEKRIKSVYFSSLNIPLNFIIFKFVGEPLFVLLRNIV
ncbi:hypothetical protein HYU18_04790 [Candidatus Woesearchaeota archaeon]|nr:hypothetical protein [Candidatus Woesearchaeota archaeon]